MLAALAGCGGADELATEPAYVADAACEECHVDAFAKWESSNHFAAMQPASEATVVGDFDDAELTHFGVATRFSRRGEAFLVTTEGSDGAAAEYEIAYTFGVEPLQQYLIKFPGGRLQSLTLAWDVSGQRWFSLYPDEKIASDDPLHWTGLYQRWNHMCADCHSTDLRRGYERASDSYQTEWSELTVGCQACHGPGERHISWARERESGAGNGYGDDSLGLAVLFPGADARGEIETCAPCHSRRHAVSADDSPGGSFYDDYMVETLREGLYYSDGQIQDEVYVYGSFLQSKMYAEGVRCTNCHDPHAAETWSVGNGVCTRCHQTTPPDEFSTLESKEYDVEAHHHHKAGSTGAECANCHAPERTYMQVDPRRDHSFRIPRPDLSLKLGTPNACAMCHDDKPVEWAADASARLWGSEHQRAPHFGEALAAGRAGEPGSGAKLIRLALNTEQPGIARATALEMLRQAPSREALDAMARLTIDEEPLVRAKAAAGLELLGPEIRAAALAPLLRDPIRAVRVEAARVFASIPAEQVAARDKQAFEAALSEYVATQEALSDTPAARLNLAVLAASRGDAENAEELYRAALAIDPYFIPAALNLATMLDGQSRLDEAEQTLRDAALRIPENGEVHYSLGLLLAAKGELSAAAEALGRAAELMPGRARVRYNQALALQQIGRINEAESALLAADRLAPGDADIVYAVVTFYMQNQRPREALPFAVQLTQLAPGAPGPAGLLEQVRRAARQ